MLRIISNHIIDEYKKKSYKELLRARNDLIKKIQKFEKNYHKDDGIEQIPSPEDYYFNDLQNLTLLCEVIQEKYKEEMNG